MLDNATHLFIVGIKGVAMTNLAVICKQMGKSVSGSDVAEKFITEEILQKNKISVQIGFDPEKLPEQTDLVIYSAAHGGLYNPQIQEAKKRGIKVVSQAELIGEIMQTCQTSVAVCGCHGKTTTSSLLAYALQKLGVGPSYLVGAPSFNDYPGGNFGKRNYFIIEADEYGVDPPRDKTPKFLFYKPNFILATNIDFDHPDVYVDIQSVKKAFEIFFDSRQLILCADDENLMEVAKDLTLSQYETFGYSSKSDLQIADYMNDEQYSYFSLKYKGNDVGKCSISLFGKKNALNAAGVVLMLYKLGFPFEKIKDAVKDFTGAKRRFEKIRYLNNTYLFDDYAHHPKEIQTTIEAARVWFPKRRIIVVFQPHTYSRTMSLLPDFAASLLLADASLIMPIFASARETPSQFTVSSSDIQRAAEKMGKDNVKAYGSIVTLLNGLKEQIKIGDVVFTMGAGDVYKLSTDIIKIIQNEKL